MAQKKTSKAGSKKSAKTSRATKDLKPKNDPKAGGLGTKRSFDVKSNKAG